MVSRYDELIPPVTGSKTPLPAAAFCFPITYKVSLGIPFFDMVINQGSSVLKIGSVFQRCDSQGWDVLSWLSWTNV